MVSALTFNNFFSKYIADPFSNELSDKDKLIATLAQVLLTLITLSLIIPITSYLRNRTITPIEDDQTANKVTEQALIALQQTLLNSRSIRSIYGLLDNSTRLGCTELNLKNVEIQASQLYDLAEVFPNTQKITLADSNLTEEHLKRLMQFPALVALDLSLRNGISSLGLQDDHIKNLRPLFSLKMLNLNGNRCLSGQTFRSLPEALTTLFVAGCSITDEGITALSEHPLEYLALNMNSTLTGNTLNSLNKSLKIIHLGGCTSLKVEGLHETLKDFPALKVEYTLPEHLPQNH